MSPSELNHSLCLTDWPPFRSDRRPRPIVSTLVFSSAGSRALPFLRSLGRPSVERLPSSPIVRLRWWQRQRRRRRRRRDPLLRRAALGWGKIIARAVGGGGGGYDSPSPSLFAAEKRNTKTSLGVGTNGCGVGRGGAVCTVISADIIVTKSNSISQGKKVFDLITAKPES